MTGRASTRKELPRLFQRFIGASKRRENNFGIGLSLSRRVLAAQQNGTVQEMSHQRRGFILRWYKGTI